MKLAIFTWGLPRGSFSNLAAALAKGFWNLGVRELFVLYLYHGPGKHITFPDGVKVIRLGVPRSFLSPLPLIRFLKYAQPDFLITMPATVNMPSIAAWFLSKRLHKTKLIVTEHSTVSFKAYIEHRHDPRIRFQPFLLPVLYPLSDGLVANSRDVLEDLIKNIQVPVNRLHHTWIPNPVDIQKIQRLSKDESDHPWLREKKGPVIISLARLARQKNLPLLFKALALVRKKIDARLIVLSEGPERKNLESMIRELGLESCISLPGYSENPWCHLAKSDLFVLSSQEESFGLVIVEAMACHVPIVATDALGGGPQTILENGKYGMLVPRYDVNTFADAILRALISQDLRKRLVEAGKRRFQHFSPENVAQKWLSFLHKL